MTRAGARLLAGRLMSGYPESTFATANSSPVRETTPAAGTAGVEAGPDATPHASGPVEIELPAETLAAFKHRIAAEGVDAVRHALSAFAEHNPSPSVPADNAAGSRQGHANSWPDDLQSDDAGCLTAVPETPRLAASRFPLSVPAAPGHLSPRRGERMGGRA